jgi:hypothetical protein
MKIHFKTTILFVLFLFITITGRSQCSFPLSPPFSGFLTLDTIWQTVQTYDGDLYSFNAAQYDTVYISYCDGGGYSSYDTYITVYDAMQSPILFDDDACATFGPSELAFVIPSSGLYYIYITFYDPANPADPCTGDGFSPLGDLAYRYTHQSGGVVVTGTPAGSIGPYFVEGVSPVFNSISISGIPPGAVFLDYYATDPSYSQAYDSLINVPVGTNWSLDMGGLPPNTVIWAYYKSGAGARFGYSNDYVPSIIAKPAWLVSNGYVSNISVSSNTVNMKGHFLFNNAINVMPGNIPGLGNKPFDLTSPEFQCDINFNCGNGLASASQPTANFNLNIFNQLNPIYADPVTNLSTLSFDSNFNPTFIGEADIITSNLSINWPLAKLYPLLPLPVPVVSIDGILNIESEVKTKIKYDFNNAYNAWGVDTARITAKINGSGTLRVSADAIIASASGSLIAQGSIGGGFVYSDFPSPGVNSLFGLSLDIAGAIDYKIWGLPSNHYERSFYNETWGDQLRSPFTKKVWEDVDAMGTYKSLSVSNPYLITPRFFSQPHITANDSVLYIVWLDYDNNGTQLLFSTLDYQTGNFSSPITITSGNVISNPKIAIFNDGNALVTWTQNRYTSATFDSTTMNLSNVFRAQDIYTSFFNKSTNSFTIPSMIPDDMTTYESGRAEGSAMVSVGNGTKGIISWVVSNDSTNTNSDVWYCTVNEVSNIVILGTPLPLISLPGVNRAVSIDYWDQTNAIACWINDPDGDENTLDSRVMIQQWDELTQTWGSLSPLILNNGNQRFDEVSLDFNGLLYGGAAWTTTEYSPNGDFIKAIWTCSWNSSTENWNSVSWDTSSVYYYSQPKVSANNNGIVALTYQQLRSFQDTIRPDVGVLNLYVNNSVTAPNNWDAINGSPLLGDPAVYDWSLSTTYGDQNYFYIITQESDTITGEAPINPPNGTRFGSGYLNLVFRSLSVTPGVVTDLDEPSVTFTNQNNPGGLVNIYPNPFNEYTNINYVIYQRSNVKIEIIDMCGKRVASLFDRTLTPGNYTLEYRHHNLSQGIYLCRLMINDQVLLKKIVVQ